MSVSSNLTFGPDTTQQCVLVLLVQDRVCESTMTESFGVRLTSMGSRPAEQDTTNVVIYDSPECSMCSTSITLNNIHVLLQT